MLGRSFRPPLPISLESLQESEGKVNDYLLASYDECDAVLNTEFNVEENTTNILNRDKLEALMVSHPSSVVQSSKPGFARFKITSTSLNASNLP